MIRLPWKKKETSLRDLAPFIAAGAAFMGLILWKMGAVSYTFDEMMDSAIASCYQETLNPFNCPEDITQTRFPYYVHALARVLLGPFTAHADQLVSAAAALALFAVLARFAWSAFGRRAAIVTAFVAAFSFPLLAAGRMVMTHSNVIFALVTVSSVAAFHAYLKRDDQRLLALAGALFGLSIASSVLGLYTAVLFFCMFTASQAPRRRLEDMVTFGTSSVGGFFLFSVFHVVPEHIVDAYGLVRDLHKWTNAHNYLWMGSDLAPRWYSFLLFAVKNAPWFLPFFVAAPLLAAADKDRLRRTTVVSVFFFTVAYLTMKSGFFRYDAPHHHVHLAPFFALLCGYAVDALWEKSASAGRVVLASAVGAGIVLQAVSAALLFPHFILYGAQFHPRLRGEFYGPAAMQCQDMTAVRGVVDDLLRRGEEVLTLIPLCWRFPLAGTHVNGEEPEPILNHPYTYVVVGWGEMEQLRLNSYGLAAKAFLHEQCTVVFSHDIPYFPQAYRVYRCPSEPELGWIHPLTLPEPNPPRTKATVDYPY